MTNIKDIQEGDLVEAVRGETKLTGRIAHLLGDLAIDGVGWSTRNLLDEGFTLTVIEKAKPKLPTEWGAYADVDGDLWVLDRNGKWWDFSNGENADYQGATPFGYTPLTKLEPVAETARKVLAAVRKAHFTDDPTYWGKLDQIAAEFGVAK